MGFLRCSYLFLLLCATRYQVVEPRQSTQHHVESLSSRETSVSVHILHTARTTQYGNGSSSGSRDSTTNRSPSVLRLKHAASSLLWKFASIYLLNIRGSRDVKSESRRWPVWLAPVFINLRDPCDHPHIFFGEILINISIFLIILVWWRRHRAFRALGSGERFVWDVGCIQLSLYDLHVWCDF